MTADTTAVGTGIIYVLTNGAMLGLAKIGRTSGTAEARAAQLNTTGVPEPFAVRAAFRVADDRRVERALHEAFAPYRWNSSREFFRVEPHQVRAILRLLGNEAVAEDITEEVGQDPSIIPHENIARRPRRPRADFQVMQIPIGAEIKFIRSDATAKIAGRQTVLFKGEEMSLASATRRLLPGTTGGRAYSLWRYGDELLWDIYDRCYPC